MPYEGGWTNTYEAFLLARTQCFNTSADRNYASNVAFIITDGVPTAPQPDDRARREALEQNDKLKNPDPWSRGATVFRYEDGHPSIELPNCDLHEPKYSFIFGQTER